MSRIRGRHAAVIAVGALAAAVAASPAAGSAEHAAASTAWAGCNALLAEATHAALAGDPPPLGAAGRGAGGAGAHADRSAQRRHRRPKSGRSAGFGLVGWLARPAARIFCLSGVRRVLVAPVGRANRAGFGAALCPMHRVAGRAALVMGARICGGPVAGRSARGRGPCHLVPPACGRAGRRGCGRSLLWRAGRDPAAHPKRATSRI